MRSEFFKAMSNNKQRFIEEIKSGRNPNPLRNRVGEEYEKPEESVATVATSLLQVERVYDEQRCEHQEQEDVVMENLGVIRRVSFMERFREAFLRRLYEWFEVSLAEV